MAAVYNNVLEMIGHTPIVQLHNCVPDNGHTFLAKIESSNPGGSVKDRIALSIIEAAEKSGQLKPGGTLVEATSGNTGIGLAMVAALKGYKCVFVMPEKISEEKRATLRAYGARVVITPTGVAPDDPRSHYAVAKKFVEITPGAYLTNQYHNPANTKAHYDVTGPEIWEQTGGKIDVFVGGAGTGGTLSGVGKYLKEKNPNVKIVCADPFGSILFDLFYYKEVRTPPHPYLVEGIGEDMLPDNVHFNVMDDFVRIDDRAVFQKTREIARTEGLLMGPSCGAALVAAIEYSKSAKLKKPSVILSLFPDGGRGYLSKVYNDQWMRENGLLPSSFDKATVRDLLQTVLTTAKTQSVSVRATVKEVIAFAKQNGLTHIPILDGKMIAGIVDIADVLNSLAGGKVRPDESVLHVTKITIPEINEAAILADLQSLLSREAFVRTKESGTLISRTDLAEYLSSFFGEFYR